MRHENTARKDWTQATHIVDCQLTVYWFQRSVSVCRSPRPCESRLQVCGAAVCGFTGRRGMCGSCANFCTALQCAAGRAGVTRHNLQIPRGLAKLARVPRPGAAAGVPAPHSAACNCRVRAAPRSRHSQGSVAAPQLCNSPHIPPPGAAHSDAVALVRGYWDIAAILWLEWSSLWCNRRAPLISGARCCAVATAVELSTKFCSSFDNIRRRSFPPSDKHPNFI